MKKLIYYYGSYYSPRGEYKKQKSGMLPPGATIKTHTGEFVALPNGGVICGCDRNDAVYAPAVEQDAADMADGYTDGCCVVQTEDYSSLVAERIAFRDAGNAANAADREMRATPEYQAAAKIRAAESLREILESNARCEASPDREDAVQGWGFAD